MSSRLLTLMRKRGAAFNPLSLNPTLWALPANSFSRTGGQFAAASSQYLSVGSNSTLQTGDVNFWIAAWLKRDAAGSYEGIVAKGLALSPGGEFYAFFNNANNTIIVRFRKSDNSGYNEVVSAAIPLATWTFVMIWHDSAADTINIQIDDNTPVSAVMAGGVYVGTNALSVGSIGASNYLSGGMDNLLFGKNNIESFANIATTLFNSNNGLPFQSITAQQQSDWGIVSGWLDNSLTADAFGSNTLTNNNGVTQAAGKVNAVAVDNDPTYFVDDATPNDNDLTQVTLANRPIYKSAGYWTFDGTNDVLPAASFAVPSYPFCMVAVIKADNTSGNKSVITIGEVAEEFGLNVTTDTLRAYARSSNSDSGASVAFTDTSNYNIAVAVFEDADTRKVYLNGASTASVTATRNVNPSSLGLKIGDRFAASQPFDGNIAEVIIFSDYTTSKLNAYGNYLVAKYPSLALSWTDI